MFGTPTTQLFEFGLFHLEVGQKYTLVITGSGLTPALEFQHADDRTNWWPDPNPTLVPAANVVLTEFRCVSNVMRLDFGSVPPGGTKVSVIADAVPEF